MPPATDTSLTDACRRCGQTSGWLLRPVREVDGVMPVENRGSSEAAVLVGWYEAVVCIGCGWTQFWARDFDANRAPQPIDGCAACGGGSGWVVEEAPDVVWEHYTKPIRVFLGSLRNRPPAGPGWLGHLAARICAQCSAASWLCRPDAPNPRDRDEPPRSPRECRRCQSAQTLSAVSDSTLSEENYRPTRAIVAGKERGIVLQHMQRRGRFELDVCRQCMTVEWYGRELEHLKASPTLGVFRIERLPAGTDSGPYR